MTSETWALILGSVGRFVTYAAAAVVIGTAGAQFVVRRAWRRTGVTDTREIEGRVLRIGLIAAGLLVATAGWRLYAHTYSVFGIEDPVTWEFVRLIAMDTGWGRGWWTQVVTASAAVIVLLVAPRVEIVRVFGPGVAAVGVAVGIPLTGHAAAEANPWLGVSLLAVHVMAVGLWIGTLAVTLLSTRRLDGAQEPERLFANAIHEFSPVAVTAVSTLAAAGLITAWMHLESVSLLWSTAYGRTLAVKVLLFGATGALGAYNWKRLKPVLGQPGSMGTLRKVARFELTLAGIVLAVTAAMVVLPIMVS